MTDELRLLAQTDVNETLRHTLNFQRGYKNMLRWIMWTALKKQELLLCYMTDSIRV